MAPHKKLILTTPRHPMANILVVEDEQVLGRNVCEALRFSGHDVSVVRTGEEALDVVDKSAPDIVLLDYRLPGIDGLEVLRNLKSRGADASTILVTAHGNIDIAVQAMRSGASDFLSKPLDLKELQIVISRELDRRRLSGQLNYFRTRERAGSGSEQIIGSSASIRELNRFIERLVSTPALSSKESPSMLITGETGTGKDLVARVLHYAGPRREGQFVHVNCTALPDHLVEAELFGHVKGAFTDARSDKRGLLEFAEGGTVFLDEIGHMEPSIQAKLLQAVERRIIRPVGGTTERKIDVHFIAATNRDLESAIQTGDFREDLYHRLRTLTVHLVPLRERREDIDLLADHFLALHAAKFGLNVNGFTARARAAMRAYDWPGNVRELAHTLESAVLFADGPTVDANHLGIVQPSADDTATLDVRVNDAPLISIDFSRDCPTLDEIEFRIITAALEYSKHNLSRAARILGVSRDAIRYRVEKFNQKSGDTEDTA